MSTVAIDWLSAVFPLECNTIAETDTPLFPLECNTIVETDTPLFPLECNTIAETDTPLFPLECNTIVETDTPLGNSAHSKQHMWQSQVEIEHYSVADFDLITVFEALKCKTFVKGDVTIHASMLHILDLPLTEVLHYSVSNAVMWLKYATEQCSISSRDCHICICCYLLSTQNCCQVISYSLPQPIHRHGWCTSCIHIKCVVTPLRCAGTPPQTAATDKGGVCAIISV